MEEHRNHTVFTDFSILQGSPVNCTLDYTSTNFFILVWLLRRKKFDGQIMGSYLFIYGVARFFLEFLRGDAGRGQFFDTWMTTTQFIAILMVLGGGILWMRGARTPALAEAA